MVLKLTKKPENRTVGMLDTGPKKTPDSTLIPAPISKPKLCDTNEVNTQMHTNIEMRCNSIGCDVK